MKYLFVVQGEGRGHLTQALSMEKLLIDNGHEVVKILVGKNIFRELPAFFIEKTKAPVTHFTSPNFLPSAKNKRSNIFLSILYNVVKTPRYIRNISFIKKQIKSSDADAVINFYELLTGLTYFFTNPGVPYYCIGHQYIFMHEGFKRVSKNINGVGLLNFFSFFTCINCKKKIALSFRDIEGDVKNNISVVPPLIRKEVLDSNPTEGDFILGYILNDGFADSVMDYHKKYPETKLYFFWDRKNAATETVIDDTLTFHFLDDVEFIKKMAGCKAYATTAGFESVCEALYLGKPVLMVPAHVEQDCNAQDARLLGAGVVSDTFDLEKLLEFSKNYKPLKSFSDWEKKTEEKILEELA